MDSGTKYWIIVASKDHVKTGITVGVAQTSHEKAAHDFALISLQMLQKDDV